MILYGIPNCDTVAKARRWLDQAGVDYQFHNFRVDGITAQQIASWCDRADWTTLLNKRSTSELMTELPTLIKRPVLVTSDWIEVGFKPDRYQQLLG